MGLTLENGWDEVSTLRVKLRRLDFAYEDAKLAFDADIAEQQYNRVFGRLQDSYARAYLDGKIPKETYVVFLGIFAEFLEAHKKVREQQEAQPPKRKEEPPTKKQEADSSPVKMVIRHTLCKGTTKWRSAEERKKLFSKWGLLEPRNIEKLPFLEFARGHFVCPDTIDLRDYCLKTSDQGSNPWCAAYAAAGFVSNILWRKTDIPPTIDAEPLYKIAKELDGAPDADGTTLTAVYHAVLDKGYFDDKVCAVKVLRNKDQVKYAIHKFGCCLLGMMVTSEWYYCNPNKTTISGKDPTTNSFLGGHAVLCCGYNPDGVIIQNSWGMDWGGYGFALVTWDEFEREFTYGAVIDNCLYDTKMN